VATYVNVSIPNEKIALSPLQNQGENLLHIQQGNVSELDVGIGVLLFVNEQTNSLLPLFLPICLMSFQSTLTTWGQFLYSL